MALLIGNTEDIWTDEHEYFNYVISTFDPLIEIYEAEGKDFNWLLEISNILGLINCEFRFLKFKKDSKVCSNKNVFENFSEKTKLNKSRIWQACLFLDEWKSGHYFEIQNKPLTCYKKGDYAVWTYDENFLQANLGSDNMYILEILGIRDE
jgi:hypothetical protein